LALAIGQNRYGKSFAVPMLVAGVILIVAVSAGLYFANKHG